MTSSSSATVAIQWLKIKQKLGQLLRQSVRTNHNRLITFGLVVIVLFYVPLWLSVMWESTAKGSSVLLNLGFTYLGLQGLWKNRRQLAQLHANEEEQVLGYLLILGGALLVAFCQSSISLQALLAMVMVVGIVWSSWGARFFQHHLSSLIWLLFSLYPDWGFISYQIWMMVTPANILENSMAAVSAQALRIIGQPAQAQGQIVSLPAGSVLVGNGCSGFDMAFTIALASLLLGLLLKQSWISILKATLVGIALALLFNVPRIMMLTFASVYWGKESFEFWHGPIGGQIFSGILFTVYYYLVMWIVDRQPKRVQS
jgi:exosortase